LIGGQSGQAMLVVPRRSNRPNRNNETDDRRRIETRLNEPIGEKRINLQGCHWKPYIYYGPPMVSVDTLFYFITQFNHDNCNNNSSMVNNTDDRTTTNENNDRNHVKDRILVNE